MNNTLDHIFKKYKKKIKKGELHSKIYLITLDKNLKSVHYNANAIRNRVSQIDHYLELDNIPDFFNMFWNDIDEDAVIVNAKYKDVGGKFLMCHKNCREYSLKYKDFIRISGFSVYTDDMNMNIECEPHSIVMNRKSCKFYDITPSLPGTIQRKYVTFVFTPKLSLAMSTDKNLYYITFDCL